jgi:hypothetical protein
MVYQLQHQQHRLSFAMTMADDSLLFHAHATRVLCLEEGKGHVLTNPAGCANLESRKLHSIQSTIQIQRRRQPHHICIQAEAEV